MKKIRLDVEELEVRSFETEAVPETRGTVRGHYYTDGADASCYMACFPMTDEYAGCGQSGHTCGPTCDWACYEGSYVCPSDTGGCD